MNSWRDVGAVHQEALAWSGALLLLRREEDAARAVEEDIPQCRYDPKKTHWGHSYLEDGQGGAAEAWV